MYKEHLEDEKWTTNDLIFLSSSKSRDNELWKSILEFLILEFLFVHWYILEYYI